MKKIIIISLFLASLVVLQGCGGICGCKPTPPVGVIQFDPKNPKTIVGYDFNIVDTTGGFTTMPSGFIAETNGSYAPLPENKQVKWIEGMLLSFQKRFKVKVTNYKTLFIINGQNQVYITVFFEPAINPQIQSLISSNDKLKTQNETLQANVKALNLSVNRTKKQLNQIQKQLEEKK